MGMTKKQIAIERFDNFLDNTKIKTELCYNFLPSYKLGQSYSVRSALFPPSYGSAESLELNTTDANLQNIKGVTFFKQFGPAMQKSVYRILLYGEDEKIYINELFNGHNFLFWLYSLTFDSAPISLSYKKDDSDVVILASKEKMVVWKAEKSPYTVPDVPVITSMCMNDGVLFCSIQAPAYKVWYATDLDAENIGNIGANSGYISFEDELGDAKKIIALDEEVYVFREFGISKIKYLQNSITTSQIYATNSRILENTVCACGNFIIFMTFDGLYIFNGVKVTKMDIDIKNMLDGLNKNAVSSSLGNKYYLALRLNYNDNKTSELDNYNYINNTILVINTDDFSFHFMRGYDVQSFQPAKTTEFEKLLFTSNTLYSNKLCEIVPTSENYTGQINKYWRSGELTKNNNQKLFTTLTVNASKNVNFTFLYDDDKIATFTTYKDGVNKFNFRLYCKTVKLEITTDKKSAEVNKVSMDYYDC